MLPINPLPHFRAVRPLLLIGLAAGAAALALWARRKITPTRVPSPWGEPTQWATRPVEVPLGTELSPSLPDPQPVEDASAATA